MLEYEVNTSIDLCNYLKSELTLKRSIGLKCDIDLVKVKNILEQLICNSNHECKIHNIKLIFYETVHNIMYLGNILNNRKSTDLQRITAKTELSNIAVKYKRFFKECCPVDCLYDVLKIMAESTIDGVLFIIDILDVIYVMPSDYIFNTMLTSIDIEILMYSWLGNATDTINNAILNELKLTTNIYVPCNLLFPPLDLIGLQLWFINGTRFWNDIKVLILNLSQHNYPIYKFNNVKNMLAWTYTALCAIHCLPQYIQPILRTYIGI